MSKVRPSAHKWDDLRAADPPSKEEQRVDMIFATVFCTQAGVEALDNMHLLTTWKRNLPDSSDGALRELEAQRRFVAILEARIQRHLNRDKDGGRTNSGSTQSGRRSASRRGPP